MMVEIRVRQREGSKKQGGREKCGCAGWDLWRKGESDEKRGGERAGEMWACYLRSRWDSERQIREGGKGDMWVCWLRSGRDWERGDRGGGGGGRGRCWHAGWDRDRERQIRAERTWGEVFGYAGWDQRETERDVRRRGEGREICGLAGCGGPPWGGEWRNYLWTCWLRLGETGESGARRRGGRGRCGQISGCSRAEWDWERGTKELKGREVETLASWLRSGWDRERRIREGGGDVGMLAEIRVRLREGSDKEGGRCGYAGGDQGETERGVRGGGAGGRDMGMLAEIGTGRDGWKKDGREGKMWTRWMRSWQGETGERRVDERERCRCAGWERGEAQREGYEKEGGREECGHAGWEHSGIGG